MMNAEWRMNSMQITHKAMCKHKLRQERHK